MMKKILSAAFAAMMLISVPMFAQTQGSENTVATGQNMKKARVARDGARDFKCDSLKCNVFEEEFKGINLTDNQKEQIKALKEKERAEGKAKRDSMKAMRSESKEKLKADRNAIKAEREQSRRNYLNEIKKIIGPDDYVVFLENNFVQHSSARPDIKKGSNPMKMDAKGPRGEKGKMAKCDKKDCKDKKGSKSGKGKKS